MLTLRTVQQPAALLIRPQLTNRHGHERLSADYTDGAKRYPLDYAPFPDRAAGALDELRRATARWRSAVAGADDRQALQVGYSSYPTGMDRDLPFVDIVWWMNRELIHHGADAAIVRDLYAARR